MAEREPFQLKNWRKYIIPVEIIIVAYCIYCCFLIKPSQTTFILVRHAEKTGSGLSDPLTSKGFQRADTLAHMLSNIDIDAVYATQYLRTQQTVSPTATSKGLSVAQYTSSANASDIESFLNQVYNDHKGKTVLIAGHSNTVPLMVNDLIGNNQVAQISESVFDNLFLVTATSTSSAKLHHLKYSFQTP